MKKLSKDELLKMTASSGEQKKAYVKVGMSTCGIAAGAQDVFDLFNQEAAKRGIDVDVKRCGCLGMCHAEPLVEVYVQDLPVVIYGRVDKEAATRILEEHLIEKRLVNDHIFDLPVRR